MTDKPIALISMPTFSAEFPSFQLALLKPTLQRAGFQVQTFSLYMYFGAHIGWPINEALSNVRPCMAGEWIWSKAAFGDFAQEQAYLEYYHHSLLGICREASCTLEDLQFIRSDKVFSFLDFCMKTIEWQRFGAIGFSVSFQQMLASLSLAQRLKERFAHIPILFGGATFEDDIAQAIAQGCDYIDYIHCGDGDETLPQILRRLQAGESLEGQPGIMYAEEGTIRYAGRAPNLADLNTTPPPDFDEYFYARQESQYNDSPLVKEPMLPIETARGCWWGSKNHCAFCGLNRAGIEFRAKSVDNVLDMVKTLSQRYRYFTFDAIDNIMAPEYGEQLFARLAEMHSDLAFHYEVRPSLSHTQLRQLRQGGLCSVQPGVESFSTHVLQLMKKHITGVRNVAFVKWCTYYNINNLYNILYGFAGETEEDYRLQCLLIPKLLHFQPPWAIARARADRGSPMFTQPEAFGIRKLTPASCYQHLYPSDRFDLRKISYYFEHEMDSALEEQHYDNIHAWVLEWQERWKCSPRPFLRYIKAPDMIVIEDGRRGSSCRYVYTDRAVDLYEFCHDVRTPKAIHEAFDNDTDWIQPLLDEWLERGLILHLDGCYLSLALPCCRNF